MSIKLEKLLFLIVIFFEYSSRSSSSGIPVGNVGFFVIIPPESEALFIFLFSLFVFVVQLLKFYWSP